MTSVVSGFTFDEVVGDDDTVIEHEVEDKKAAPVQFIVDPLSLQYLILLML